jgi:hypothetical protein
MIGDDWFDENAPDENEGCRWDDRPEVLNGPYTYQRLPIPLDDPNNKHDLARVDGELKRKKKIIP